MKMSIRRALTYIHTIKKWMSLCVLTFMMIIVGASIIELGIILFMDIFDPTDDVLFLDIGELLNIFGFIFLILIGFELMETIEMYFKKNVIHAEIVLLVAVIAVARKVILLDLEKYDPLAVVGLGGIIVALGACYYLIKRSH